MGYHQRETEIPDVTDTAICNEYRSWLVTTANTNIESPSLLGGR
jgi:hypothetical protein